MLTAFCLILHMRPDKDNKSKAESRYNNNGAN